MVEELPKEPSTQIIVDLSKSKTYRAIVTYDLFPAFKIQGD
jgi:hypothetical protein